jgi:hypothetical protein
MIQPRCTSQLNSPIEKKCPAILCHQDKIDSCAFFDGISDSLRNKLPLCFDARINIMQLSLFCYSFARIPDIDIDVKKRHAAYVGPQITQENAQSSPVQSGLDVPLEKAATLHPQISPAKSKRKQK